MYDTDNDHLDAFQSVARDRASSLESVIGSIADGGDREDDWDDHCDSACDKLSDAQGRIDEMTSELEDQFEAHEEFWNWIRACGFASRLQTAVQSRRMLEQATEDFEERATACVQQFGKLVEGGFGAKDLGEIILFKGDPTLFALKQGFKVLVQNQLNEALRDEGITIRDAKLIVDLDEVRDRPTLQRIALAKARFVNAVLAKLRDTSDWFADKDREKGFELGEMAEQFAEEVEGILNDSGLDEAIDELERIESDIDRQRSDVSEYRELLSEMRQASRDARQKHREALEGYKSATEAVRRSAFLRTIFPDAPSDDEFRSMWDDIVRTTEVHFNDCEEECVAVIEGLERIVAVLDDIREESVQDALEDAGIQVE